MCVLSPHLPLFSPITVQRGGGLSMKSTVPILLYEGKSAERLCYIFFGQFGGPIEANQNYNFHMTFLGIMQKVSDFRVLVKRQNLVFCKFSELFLN